ncbi:MAG: serine hydrolase domain-containing protein [Psychroserpens sp.]|uniref:serine hydrolase domain-containing protein n=1 Tax=Psychroserpens sp. TaxID=2020870 RepID=UPI003003570C
MKQILVILMIAINIFSVKAQKSIPQQASIDAIFSRWDSPDSPGGTVGIIKEGKLIFAKGYGSANLDYNIPNESQTVYRIGSTSKQFTAACVILLSQQGKLSLEDKLIKFFPDFPAYANDITIQHLLNHTSGIRDYPILARLSGLGSEDFYTDQIVKKWLTNQEELNFNPGDEYLYSNSGYWLLSEIVKSVSGVTMAEYAEENIFIPLEMNDTHFHNDHKQIVKNRASGYRPNRQGGYSISMTTLDMIGDGGIFTTVEDLAKWDASFYGSEILNNNFWGKMTRVGTLNNGKKITYASGLDVTTYKGLKIIKHSGSMVGFTAEMIRFPEVQFSVIILANRAGANPTRMAYQVANLFLENEYKKEKSTETINSDSEEVSLKPISLTKEELQGFEGEYWSSNKKISRKLEVLNDTLNYVRDNGRATQMFPISNDKFQMIGPKVPIVLVVNSTVNPKEFSLKLPNEPLSTFVAYTPLTSYSASDLDTYSGDYYCAELDVVYTLKAEEKGIMLYINGNFVGSVKQVMKDLLSRNSRMTFEFNETRDMFRLSMVRVKNLKFVKR